MIMPNVVPRPHVDKSFPATAATKINAKGRDPGSSRRFNEVPCPPALRCWSACGLKNSILFARKSGLGRGRPADGNHDQMHPSAGQLALLLGLCLGRAPVSTGRPGIPFPRGTIALWCRQSSPNTHQPREKPRGGPAASRTQGRGLSVTPAVRSDSTVLKSLKPDTHPAVKGGRGHNGERYCKDEGER
jgi:hypothetical protein